MLDKKREQPEHKALSSSGCLYCVGDAETKVEVFERNPEEWQHPQEKEECVRRGHKGEESVRRDNN